VGEEFAIDRKVLAVVNPKAGQGRAGRKWDNLKTIMTRPDWELDEAFTTAPGDATRITRDAILAGYDVVLAVGGDGTVNEVVNGFFNGENLIDRDVHLGVVPAGSGGDFVRSLDEFKLCSGFNRSSSLSDTYCLDVGKVIYTGEDCRQHVRYFINVADVGIGAETVKRVEAGYKRLGGRLGFFSGTVVTMVLYRNTELEVSIDDYQTKGRYASIVIAKGRYFGGGMEVAPLAKLSSGVFSVLSIGDLSRLDLIGNFLKVYKGTHLSHPGIDSREAKSVRVRSEKAIPLETDGEHTNILEATFAVFPSAIKLLI
jgi:diacylglycerol kinase (ATP)